MMFTAVVWDAPYPSDHRNPLAAPITPHVLITGVHAMPEYIRSADCTASFLIPSVASSIVCFLRRSVALSPTRSISAVSNTWHNTRKK